MNPSKILIINLFQIDLSNLYEAFNNKYDKLIVSKSIQDVFKNLRNEHIDLIILILPSIFDNSFVDFFAVLRQTYLFIPIVGLKYDENTYYDEKFFTLDIDEFLDLQNKEVFLLRLNNSIYYNKLFDFRILNCFRYNEISNFFNVATLLCTAEEVINNDLIKTNYNAVQLSKQNFNCAHADIVLIKIKNDKTLKFCSEISFQIGRYKPIVLLYDNNTYEYAKLALESNVGCNCILNMFGNKRENTKKILSLIKYSKMHTKFEDSIQKSTYSSMIDSLTDVYNRAFLNDYFHTHMELMKHSVILMIDVDKFKSFNDNYGHAFADELLKYIAQILRKNIRNVDILARYGGDEFVILMKDITEDIINTIVERIRVSIKNTDFMGINCTVSIGGVLVINSEKIHTKDALVKADECMYFSKKQNGDFCKIINI